MVSRIYVEKKPGFDVEAQQLKGELTEILGIKGIEALRIINRYDVEGIDEELFRSCVPTVFSEPQVDVTYDELPASDGAVFAVEFLPGQFDQRADSASECVQLISQGERPAVRSAKVYMISGALDEAAIDAIKHYVVNPVEARIASLDLPETLYMETPEPQPVEVLDGFRKLDEAGLAAFIADRGLAMDEADIAFCQQYFRDEDRDPTITEIRVIDTYWSDHCRHTTFGTVLDDVTIDDAVVQQAFDRYMEMRHELGRDAKPVCLMDMGTIGAKYLKKTGVMTDVDESEEINACTVKVKVDVDGGTRTGCFCLRTQDHNHPTGSRPFGGAATCVGGAIATRSRAAATRVPGHACHPAPVTPPSSFETLGQAAAAQARDHCRRQLSSMQQQMKPCHRSQSTNSYHPVYVAKRMEGWRRRGLPRQTTFVASARPPTKIVLLGGRTGLMAASVAPPAPPRPRTPSPSGPRVPRIQKRRAHCRAQAAASVRTLCRLIKRCNDCSAGASRSPWASLPESGLYLDLDTVTRSTTAWTARARYLSESQERMACAVADSDVERFMGYAAEENLEATVIAEVTAEPRSRCGLERRRYRRPVPRFLNSSSAPKHQVARVRP